MFIEIRKQGKQKKYYLIHSYRVGDKVKRVSRYLGSNLNQKTLNKLKLRAEKIILEQIQGKDPFEYELNKEEIEAYKRYDKKIQIQHLQKELDWKKFKQDFTYNTNAIEGSTVEKIEVKELLENKDKPENFDEQETLQVAKAIEFVSKTKEKLSLKLIEKLHFICFEKTKSFAGKIRKVEVVIRDAMGCVIHQGVPYTKVEDLLQELIKWYLKYEKKYPPLLLAAVVHNQFEHIHPFQDGNGRVGRLLLNYVLITHNYPPINIKLGSRKRYYKTLQEYDKKGDIKSTLRFLVSQYKK